MEAEKIILHFSLEELSTSIGKSHGSTSQPFTYQTNGRTTQPRPNGNSCHGSICLHLGGSFPRLTAVRNRWVSFRPNEQSSSPFHACHPLKARFTTKLDLALHLKSTQNLHFFSFLIFPTYSDNLLSLFLTNAVDSKHPTATSVQTFITSTSSTSA